MIFHSYVKLPEGNYCSPSTPSKIMYPGISDWVLRTVCPNLTLLKLYANCFFLHKKILYVANEHGQNFAARMITRQILVKFCLVLSAHHGPWVSGFLYPVTYFLHGLLGIFHIGEFEPPLCDMGTCHIKTWRVSHDWEQQFNQEKWYSIISPEFLATHRYP